eukprot:scaffold292_cov161-Ochromonas_danica.AAC.3
MTIIMGQDETALEVFLSLGLSKREIDLFYTAFWDIDADSSGETDSDSDSGSDSDRVKASFHVMSCHVVCNLGHIRPSELFSYFEVEETPFEVALFSIFDEDKSGLINFMEFVCTLWNILTLPVEECACIAYLIKDPTADATITCTFILIPSPSLSPLVLIVWELHLSIHDRFGREVVN